MSQNRMGQLKAAYQSRLARTAANGNIAPVARHNGSTYRNYGCRCKVCLDGIAQERGYKTRTNKAPARPAMTEDEQRTLLERIRPKLKRLATTLAWDADYIDELAQEGWIGVWKEVNDKGYLPEGILMSCAKNKMLHRMRFDMQQCRDVRRSIPVSSIDWEGDISDLFGAIEVDLAEVEDAYHDGRILEAVNQLPEIQRAYVIRRFWHGWTKTPLEIYFDKNPNDIWRYAKKNLERELVKIGVME